MSIIDNWPPPTESGKFEISFKSEFSHSSQYPRAAMLWIGEAEDPESIYDLITSASRTGDPTPDFVNLDFQITSGLRKIFKRRFKKLVTTGESTERLLTDRQVAWMICDFSKSVSTMNPSRTSEIYQNFN